MLQKKGFGPFFVRFFHTRLTQTDRKTRGNALEAGAGRAYHKRLELRRNSNERH